MLCAGEVVDNDLFAEPVTPAPAARQDDAGLCYVFNAFQQMLSYLYFYNKLVTQLVNFY